MVEALFATVTNVDFDPERVAELIRRGVVVRNEARKVYEKVCLAKSEQPETLAADVAIDSAEGVDGMIRRLSGLAAPGSYGNVCRMCGSIGVSLASFDLTVR